MDRFEWRHPGADPEGPTVAVELTDHAPEEEVGRSPQVGRWVVGRAKAPPEVAVEGHGVEERLEWWSQQGIDKKNLELYRVEKDKLSHYSKKTTDIMYGFPHGKEELEGIANRTDFDLGSHTKGQSGLGIKARVKKNVDSTTRLAIQDKKNKEWVVPYVIEPSAGVDRGFLAILNDAYKKEKLDGGRVRLVLALKPHLAPIKAAVIPLKRNHPGLIEEALNIKKTLQGLQLGRILLENSGNIGKNYRRHDEIGTPLCITVDFQTLQDQTVTLRDRDTMEQSRVPVSGVPGSLRNLLDAQ